MEKLASMSDEGTLVLLDPAASALEPLNTSEVEQTEQAEQAELVAAALRLPLPILYRPRRGLALAASLLNRVQAAAASTVPVRYAADS